MSIGLLIITHNEIGGQLLDTAVNMLGYCPLLAESLAIRAEDNPDRIRARAQQLAEDLDQGDGVLVLTDMFGGTPTNLALSMLEPLLILVLGVIIAGVIISILMAILGINELVF